MPKAFDNCRRAGGRIRTEVLDKRRYRHVCYNGGKRYAGYVKRKKS